MIFKSLREEISSIRARDPAARSGLEVALCYPGLHAVLFHRAAHAAWQARLYVVGRMISQLGRFLTGIEIHPGATVGRRLFIDHGSGVVIGETAEIGDDVTLYHGVTLGGTSLATGKRHPTLSDGVIVGAGAKILGPVLVGKDARVGANAVVLADVPAGVTMVGIPARMVLPKHKSEGFHAYGCDEDLPDPVLRAVETLRKELARLQNRIDELEAEKWPLGANRVEGKAEPVEGDAP
jgi:serine O-acetyltransferase